MEIIHISKNRKLKALRPIADNIINTIQEVNTIKKCLFGVPDREEIEIMVEEQRIQDWERIKDRFGLDMQDIENMENVQQPHLVTPSAKKRKSQPKRSSSVRRRRLFSPYDRKITDFYQERKSVQVEKKEA